MLSQGSHLGEGSMLIVGPRKGRCMGPPRRDFEIKGSGACHSLGSNCASVSSSAAGMACGLTV
jgi:hypothetical protein